MVNGAATPVTIKSAKHNATNNGFRRRADDCAYNVITSDAFPKMPPNTTMQYKIISNTIEIFQIIILSSLLPLLLMRSDDIVVGFVVAICAAVSNSKAADSLSASACEKLCNCRCVNNSNVSTALDVDDDATDADDNTVDNDDDDDVLLLRSCMPLLLLLSL